MTRPILALLAIVLLPGCESLVGAEGASAVLSGERLSDRIISYASGKTCSRKRSAQGLTYCEEDEAVPQQNLYCYRTLAQVTCYERPPEFGDGQQKVGDNDHNLVGKP